MNRFVLAAAGIAALASAAAAQTANSSPTAGGGGGDAVRTAPSGGTARPDPGRPQIGAPTPLERHEEHKSEKDTASVCKGC